MWGNPSDEALLAAFGAGDSKAATAFVRRFQARVFGLAVTMVRDQAQAEEVAQEAFLRAWRHAGAYDARRGKVATWLLTITRNLALDRLRLKRADPVDPVQLAQVLEDDGSVEEASEAAGISEPIRRAAARVPEEQRRALLLAALLGCTAAEIAEIESIPLGTAKTRIRAATLKLQSELGSRDVGEV